MQKQPPHQNAIQFVKRNLLSEVKLLHTWLCFCMTGIAGSAVSRLRKVTANLQSTRAHTDLKVAQMARRQSLLLSKFVMKPADIEESCRADLVECKIRQRANCHLTFVSDEFAAFWDEMWEFTSTYFRHSERLKADTPKVAFHAALAKAQLKMRFSMLCDSIEEQDVIGNYKQLQVHVPLKYAFGNV